MKILWFVIKNKRTGCQIKCHFIHECTESNVCDLTMQIFFKAANKQMNNDFYFIFKCIVFNNTRWNFYITKQFTNIQNCRRSFGKYHLPSWCCDQWLKVYSRRLVLAESVSLSIYIYTLRQGSQYYRSWRRQVVLAAETSPTNLKFSN